MDFYGVVDGFLGFCWFFVLRSNWRAGEEEEEEEIQKNRWAEPTRLEGPFNRWLVGGVSSSTKDFPVRAVKEKQQQKKTLPKSPTKKKKKKMMMKKEKQKGLAFVWFRSPFSVAARLSASIFFCFCFFFLVVVAPPNWLSIVARCAWPCWRSPPNWDWNVIGLVFLL